MRVLLLYLNIKFTKHKHSEIFDKAEVKAKSMCEVANNFQLPKYNTCRYHSNIFFWFVYMMQHFRVWMLKSCV